VKSRTKQSVMDALIKVAELDVPKSLLEQDAERLAEMTREDMRQRGVNVKDMPFPADLFTQQADRRVRLGLILSEMVKANSLNATLSRSRTTSKISRRPTKIRSKSSSITTATGIASLKSKRWCSRKM